MTAMNFDIEKIKAVACTHAYHGISFHTNGTLDPCCQYTRDPDKEYAVLDIKGLTALRQVMHQDYVQGQRHKGCQKCYQEEDLGLETLRTLSQNMIGMPLENSILNAQLDTDTVKILHVEMRLGNLCNLKCMMCSPWSSSSIAVERLQHLDQFKQVPWVGIWDKTVHDSWWETEQFQALLPTMFKDLRWINFTGGEPFMIPQVAQWLENLVQLGLSQTVTVSFNTNLTTLTDNMLNTLSKFRKVTIMISLEGTGAHNNYVRYPSRWQVIDHNADRLLARLPAQQFGVNHTLQHASAYSLPDLAAWVRSKNMFLKFTMVQGFPDLTFESVPPQDLAKLERWAKTTTDLSQENQQFVLEAIANTKFDPAKHQRFTQYTTVLDQVRGTSWHEVFDPSPVTV